MFTQDLGISNPQVRRVCARETSLRALACLGLLALLGAPVCHSLPSKRSDVRPNRTARANASAASSLTLAPASLVFPAQIAGTTSGPVTVDVFNTSGTGVSVGSISVTGDFTATNTCTAPGSCAIVVTFSPTSTGNSTGTLTVTDTTGATAIVSLAGLGLPKGSGATTTAIAATGSSGKYNLTGTVVATRGAGSPSGTVSFADTTAANFLLGQPSLGTAQVDLSLTNGPTAVANIPAQSLVTADFNGDGKPDIAVLNCVGICGLSPSSGVWIGLGNGDGTFTAPPSQPSAPFGNSIVAGDFNGDGKIDLAVIGNATAGTVLYGNGDGTFTSLLLPVYGDAFAASGDFNHDGKSDLVLVAEGGTSPNISYSATVLLGQSNGFLNSANVATSGFLGVVVGDFNGDGFLDFAIAGASPSNIASVEVFPGKGDGTFQAPISTTAGAFFPSLGNHILAAGDFNGDRKTDLVIEGAVSNGTVSSSDGFIVMMGKGDGTFTAETPIPVAPSAQGSSYSGSVSTADFDKDGRDDVIVLTDNVVQVFLSNGDGTFTTSTSVDSGAETGPDYLDLVVNDFNGDGVLDYLISNSDANDVKVGFGQRVETAVATVDNVAIPGTGTHNVTASYSGDSNFSASTSSALPLAAAPIATSLALTSSTTTSIPGAQVTLAATLTPDSDGTLTTNGETVTFINNGSSLGMGTLSSGVATLSISSLPLGTDSITAKFAGDTNFAAATSAALSIVVSTPAPAVTLAPGSLTFSSQATGSTSTAQSVTLTNSGLAPLSITSFAASGDFSQTNTCGTSVAAGASCAISVTFTPTASGTRTGNVTITDNAAGSPQSIAISGTGSSVTLATANGSGITILSAGGSGTATLQVGSAGGFSGTVNLTCTVAYQGTGTPNAPPTCSLNPAQQQVSSGATSSVTLTVNTTGGNSALLRSLGEGTTLVAFAFLMFLPQRRWRGLAFLLVLGFVAATFTGCGGSKATSSPGSGSGQNAGTTAGSYNVTVTATSGKDIASATVPLTVQ